MHHRRNLLLIVAGLAAALVAAAAPSLAATRHYSRAATAYARATAYSDALARVTVRAAGSSAGVTATATASASALYRSSATAGASVRVQRSASRPSTARARARAAAIAAARRAAYARAHHAAYLRALAVARATAQNKALAAARSLAVTTAARSASSTTTRCQPVPGHPTCTFDDEFNGTTLDPNQWTVLTSAQTGLTMGDACFVNSPKNVYVSGGVLNLVTRKETTSFTCHSNNGDFVTQYTGANVSTYGRLFAQQYGRFAVRAKFPATTVWGLQSSLWMYPQNPYGTGHSGEIDIAEDYSRYATLPIPTVHDWDTGDMDTSYSCTIGDLRAFHEYAVEWTPTSITAYVDGKACFTDTALAGRPAFDQPFVLALSAGLGVPNTSDPNGDNAYSAKTPLPATTQIDWVRAWK